MTRTIPLTRGYVTLVDDEDYEWLNRWKWSALKGGNHFYARRNVNKSSSAAYLMHRLILGLKASDLGIVDHVNRNSLDNRKENLRIVDKKANCANASIARGSSVYRGVSWSDLAQKWRVRLRVESKTKSLGYFVDEKDAARAYNEAALEYFGEYILLNEV